MSGWSAHLATVTGVEVQLASGGDSGGSDRWLKFEHVMRLGGFMEDPF